MEIFAMLAFLFFCFIGAILLGATVIGSFFAILISVIVGFVAFFIPLALRFVLFFVSFCLIIGLGFGIKTFIILILILTALRLVKKSA